MATQKAEEGLRKHRGRRLNASSSGSKPCSFAGSAGVGQAAHDSRFPSFVSSSSFGTQLFQTIFSSHTPLGNFCRQCLHMKEDCHSSSKQLFPCPIPAKLPAPQSELRSGRRRSRFALRVTIREHLRLFVATCNWLVLGRPKQVDVSWPPCTAAQSRMLLFLEDGINLFYRLSPGQSSGLDRSFGKFSSISDSLQELLSATQSLRQDLDSYSRGSRPQGSSDADFAGEDVRESVISSAEKAAKLPLGKRLAGTKQSNTSALQLDPDRIQFKHTPSFAPEKFINDPLLKAGFLNPQHLRLPESLWPKVRRACVMCPREQLLKLFKKWDSVGCLLLLDANKSEQKYRCGLFAVYKNADKDRQILNPIPENGRTLCMNSSTLSLAHGSLLCDLYLRDDQDLLIGADDLEDFYHCFIIPPSHARRNHIHGIFPAELFRTWNAWQPDFEGKQLIGCFNTLAMGTSYAVEVAQHTHTNLLLRAGVLHPSQQVCYRKPLPRSDVLQLLCIDDLAVLQKVPRGTLAASTSVPRHDLDLLSKAGEAYKKEGLKISQKKSVRNSSHSTILGGELDGRRGILCAPRLRILMLSKLTLRLVSIGWTTHLLLETIIGSWIFVLMFRRPLLALLNDVFHEGRGISNRQEIFSLSTGAKQELMLLAIWAPFTYTNLRASPLSQIFCSDASLSGCGVCSAEISPAATLEFCRISEKKGFYTKIDTSTLGSYEALHGEGVVSPPTIPPPLQEGFLWDFAEVFRGSGHLSDGHRQSGLVVHPGFEISDGEKGDVLNPSTFLAIVGLICRRVVRIWHVAPVCTTFGTLRRPRLRSKLEPFGFSPDEPATALGNRFAMRGGFILALCFYYGLICSIEQPGGSVMYRLQCFQHLIESGFYSIRFPFCSWGTPFQKLSWWLGNNPLLSKLRGTCTCGRKGSHFRVQGTFDRRRLKLFSSMCRPSVESVFGRSPTVGEHVAKFSAAYPKPLCIFVAHQNMLRIQQSDDGAFKLPERPFSSPPHWIAELGKSLHWRKLLQYPLQKVNHININEHLAYRSLLKHVAKTSPHSRFCALLDSRVIIGCNTKGRSSSKQLNFYLASSLPYVVGGDLYPHLLHVSSGDNVSDDISRFVTLRHPSLPHPAWLVALVNGDPSAFDAVREADRLAWPYSGWSRVIRLKVLASSKHSSVHA